MKRLIFLLVIIVSILASCKKDQDISYTPPVITTIYYKDYIPDTSIGLYNRSFYLDVNNDSLSDLRFDGDEIEEFSPHSQYGFSISVYGLDSLRFLLKTGGYHSPCSSPVDSNIYISTNDILNEWLSLYYFAPVSMIYCNSYLEMNYIGFVLQKNGKKYLGWIKLKVSGYGIIVDEFASLISTNDSIRIGQH